MIKAIGIVVEGDSDAKAFKAIINKCLSDDIEIFSNICGNVQTLMRRFPKRLKIFEHVNQGSPCDMALVIRDADNKDTNDLLKRMKNKISGYNFPFDVKFIYTVQTLEAWLLADEKAISIVTQKRSGKTVSKVNKQLETITHPKRTLQKILDDANVEYNSEVAREIAEELDLSKVKRKCPHFDQLCQALND